MVKLASDVRPGLCQFCLDAIKCDVMHRDCKTADFKPKPDLDPIEPHGSTVLWKLGWDFTKRIILMRQRNFCHQCHYPITLENAKVHTLKPFGEGGTRHPKNLVAMCLSCYEKLTHRTTKSEVKAKELKKTQAVYGNYWGKVMTGALDEPTGEECEQCGLPLMQHRPCPHKYIPTHSVIFTKEITRLIEELNQ